MSQTRLSAKKLRAIDALMSGATQEETAKAAGVSRSAIQKWLKDDDFCALLQTQQREMLQAITRRIATLGSDAMTTLAGIMADEEMPAPARVSAARSLLASIGPIVELTDILPRLEQLEKLINERIS